LKYGWTLGESGWNADMDGNLLAIARFGVHLSILDRDLATPPTSPASGATYIVAASATGAWAGKSGQVALWNGSAWIFAAPRIGWIAYIEDEAKLSAYKSGGWSAGIAI
jgi:hypothetical protein